MSDYIPTTEEVRDDYVWGITDRTMIGPKEALDQFYTWLEQHDAEVASATEQRIIKLLEELSKSTFPGDVWHVNPFEYAIALVRGENK